MQFKKIAAAAAGFLATAQATGEDTTVTSTQSSMGVVTHVLIINEFPAASVSTVLETQTSTVYSCASSVSDCPASSLVTSTIPVSTTVCPLTLTSSSLSVPPGQNSSSAAGSAPGSSPAGAVTGSSSSSQATVTNTITRTGTSTLTINSSSPGGFGPTGSIPAGGGVPNSGATGAGATASVPAASSSYPTSGSSTAPGSSYGTSSGVPGSSGVISQPAASSNTAGALTGSLSSVHSTSTVVLTSTLTSTSRVTISSSSALGNMTNSTVATSAPAATPAIATPPAMSSNVYSYSPSGVTGGPRGATTGSAGIPGATANGTFSTSIPSVVPFTGTASPAYDQKLSLCTVIGLTVAVLLI